MAVVSGYQSWGACHIAFLDWTATRSGAIGLTRARHGVAGPAALVELTAGLMDEEGPVTFGASARR